MKQCFLIIKVLICLSSVTTCRSNSLSLPVVVNTWPFTNATQAGTWYKLYNPALGYFIQFKCLNLYT